MEISLVRHGKSKHTENISITFTEYNQWVEKYDDSGVVEEEFYPSISIEKMRKADVVVTSDLLRSIESAKLLQPGIQAISDPLFSEVALPTLPANFPGLKLPPGIWTALLRCLWFGGYSKQCEPLRFVKLKAGRAAHKLIQYSEDNKSVVLVGHGLFNLFIARELRRNGWKSQSKQSTKHWDCLTFSLDN
ncbi:histidine phosphatase family protein [Halobacillus naozhouensis]|uniref:Histidine phosphatase family protein n=1 Tax=Halobacillus naozhouensis TaxID=554880 RepID=A0ABY8J5G9_9BACI|nr:histidine phosphatase family protein [Halobacillus naozhouensis]WFT76010.1 histidine phosphatase family protein [Halobacillus naozhouensis]